MIAELFRHEAVTLLRQRFPYLLLALVLGVPVLRVVAGALTPPETALDVVTAPQLWAEGMAWGVRLAAYVLTVLGAMSLSQEFGNGTARMVLMQPVARWQWLTAKLMFLLAWAVALLLLAAVLSALSVALTVGWGAVVREGVVLHGVATVWSAVVGALGLTAVALLPLCAFALLVGIHFTSSGAAVGVALLLAVVLEAAANLGSAGTYVFFRWLYAPLGVVERLGKGLAYDWQPLWLEGLPVVLITFVVLGAWLLWRMQRMDITA